VYCKLNYQSNSVPSNIQHWAREITNRPLKIQKLLSDGVPFTVSLPLGHSGLRFALICSQERALLIGNTSPAAT
jgi:hypothetical protein